MNIFRTHSDPYFCALDHCDRHEPKMILETGQMLCAVHHLYGSEFDGIYKLTHANHPCTKWVGESTGNYEFAMCLMFALDAQRIKRGKPTHKTIERLSPYIVTPPKGLPRGPETPQPMCMPDEFKTDGDVEGSYIRYLNHKFSEWAGRDKPMHATWNGRYQPRWYSA